MLRFDLTLTLPQHHLHLRANLPPKTTTTILLGANGSGKSLLLSMIAGIKKPNLGYITLQKKSLLNTNDKTNLPPDKRHIGYAFQEARLFPHMSVEKNLDYPQRMQKIPPDKKQSHKNNRERTSLLEALSLSPLLTRSPATLSGGEQQRVALARAMLANPRLLLLDEPLSSVDRTHKRQALLFLHQWLRKKHIPCIYVTHDIEEIACIATHALVIAKDKEHDKNTTTHSHIIASSPIESATTDLRLIPHISSPVALIPVTVKGQRSQDGLWKVAFSNNPHAEFPLSTHNGTPPTLLDTRTNTTHARIRAEDILLADNNDPQALTAQLLDIKVSKDGAAIAQIECSNQHLLMQLSLEQARKLENTRANNNRSTCRIRIRKAQGGIL